MIQFEEISVQEEAPVGLNAPMEQPSGFFCVNGAGCATGGFCPFGIGC